MFPLGLSEWLILQISCIKLPLNILGVKFISLDYISGPVPLAECVPDLLGKCAGTCTTSPMVSGLVRATVQMSRLVKHSSCTFNETESSKNQNITRGNRLPISQIPTSAIILWKMLQRRIVWKTFDEIPCEMHCRLFFTKVLPCGWTARCWCWWKQRWAHLGRWTKKKGTHLSVESSSCAQEDFADFVHSVGVAGWIFQAGEVFAARGHGAIQTSGNISCKHLQMWSQEVSILDSPSLWKLIKW